MAQQKPGIPKGMRDFSAAQIARRDYIFNSIRSVFKLYGYCPIETPTMENLASLMGKYGQEGDRLLFKVLNSGDYAANLSEQQIRTASAICEKGLRYDLTVPFARYVVQHRDQITFPFKRYQIAPVWRADRPQKGRYREFVQCDVDVVGTDSLLCEVELVQIVEDVFKKLNVPVVLKINNRKILAGIAAAIGHPDSLSDIAVAIDKLDKIGLDGVENELLEKGISANAIAALRPILALKGNNEQKLSEIEAIIGENRGVEEIRTIFNYLKGLNLSLEVELDLSLARGLSYYTGAIFEVKSTAAEMGSISGGGRYDNLTGIFGLDGVSGVGISFGAERIYDVMEALDLFPKTIESSARALFVNFGGEDETAALEVMQTVRAAGISAEMYPSAEKLKKQFDYAEAKSIEFVVFIGETERANKTATIKNLITKDQCTLNLPEMVSALK